MNETDTNATEAVPMTSSQSVPSVSSLKKRKQMTSRSSCWSDFDKITSNEDGILRAQCKACGVQIKADSKLNGTSGMRSHIVRCKERIQPQDSSQGILGFGVRGDSKIIRPVVASIRKSLIRLIVAAELPFSIISRQEFKDFMAIIALKFHVPSRWTVQRDIFDMFSSEKEKLKEYFKRTRQRISLTTDSWTSIQRINYIVLTAHYIDENWNLQKKIINFTPITSHKRRDIGVAIDRCLRDWELDRIFTVTVDNASSNDVAVQFLKEKYSHKEESVLKCSLLHMRCVAHILNLIVKDGLKFSVHAVTKVRAAVSYIRSSPQRLAKFQECVKVEKIDSGSSLILDVATRWNSTYLMLEVALRFVKAFERYDDENANFQEGS